VQVSSPSLSSSPARSETNIGFAKPYQFDYSQLQFTELVIFFYQSGLYLPFCDEAHRVGGPVDGGHRGFELYLQSAGQPLEEEVQEAGVAVLQQRVILHPLPVVVLIVRE